MLIECASCRLRDLACGGCVVTALLGEPDQGPAGIDERERRALTVLADAGLIPPIRLMSSIERAS
jgi:hypothetical protein